VSGLRLALNEVEGLKVGMLQGWPGRLPLFFFPYRLLSTLFGQNKRLIYRESFNILLRIAPFNSIIRSKLSYFAKGE
jgi:hypothetical protein